MTQNHPQALALLAPFVAQAAPKKSGADRYLHQTLAKQVPDTNLGVIQLRELIGGLRLPGEDWPCGF